MSKFRLFVILGIVLSALGLGALANTASASTAHQASIVRVSAPAVTGYHSQSAIACVTSNCSDWVQISLHTTNTSTQVWINGSVGYSEGGGDAVQWVGVGGGNGTSDLNVGANFLKNGKSYYFRDDIHAVNGSEWCSTTGNTTIKYPESCFN